MNRLMFSLMTIGVGLASFLIPLNQAHGSGITYQTSGLVLPFGGQTGPSAVSFMGIPSQSRFNEGETFSLGDFTVTPSSDGSTSKYLNAPFLIEISGVKDNTAYPAIQVFNSIWIYGRLNGSASTSMGSSIVATIDSIQPGVVSINPPGEYDYVQILPFSPTDLNIATNTTLSPGATPILVNVTPTPEPASMACFGLIVGWIGLRRHLRKTA